MKWMAASYPIIFHKNFLLMHFNSLCRVACIYVRDSWVSYGDSLIASLCRVYRIVWSSQIHMGI